MCAYVLILGLIFIRNGESLCEWDILATTTNQSLQSGFQYFSTSIPIGHQHVISFFTVLYDLKVHISLTCKFNYCKIFHPGFFF